VLRFVAYALCKSSLNRQEKGTPCHRDGAARYRYGTDPFVLSDSSDHEPTWATDLKTLAESDFAAGLNPAVTHQPRDRAACSGAGSRIFSGVELHACAPDVFLVRRA
jgi:hypothetical protein